MARNSFDFIGDGVLALIPQQGKLMGSSAQNSSCALCRRRVRFNEVPKKVPEKSGRLGAETGHVQQGSGEGSGDGLGGFGAEPGQVQQGSGEGSGGSGEGLGGFGAEPGQVQQDLRPFDSRKPS